MACNEHNCKDLKCEIDSTFKTKELPKLDENVDQESPQ